MSTATKLRQLANELDHIEGKLEGIQFAAKVLMDGLDREGINHIAVHPDHPDICAIKQLKNACTRKIK